MKFLENSLIIEYLFTLSLAEDVVLVQYIQNHLFFLFHRALNAQNGMKLVYMKVNRLFVVKRV
jgi:hypothetical protein